MEQEQKAKNSTTPDLDWEIDNLPNRLTIFRVLLIPIILSSLGILLMPNLTWVSEYRLTLGYIAAVTFGVASITDFVDGYIARSRNIVTEFGSFLDPLADKFLVVSSLIMLLAVDRINVFLVIILVLREMYITALRLLATEKNLKVPVGQMGKVKTATQMIGIPLLMVDDTWLGLSTYSIGSIFLYFASFASIYSALQYSAGLLKKIKLKRQQQANAR